MSTLTFEPVLPLPTIVSSASIPSASTASGGPFPVVSMDGPLAPVLPMPNIATALPRFDDTLGAMLVGTLFATFLQGMLTLQLYFYFDQFHKDNWRLKALVFAVWAFDLIHLVLIIHGLYHYTVTNWGSLDALAISTWQLDSHVVVTNITSFLCQSYFVKRLWTLSERNWFLVMWPLLGALGSMTTGIVITVQIIRTPPFSNFARTTPEAIGMFSMTAATDMLIALMLCFYLSRQKTHFKRTQTIVRKVIQYTITTGLFTSVIAIVSLIEFVAKPNTFVFFITYFSLGSLYTNSLLAHLNSRQFLRNTREEHAGASMVQQYKSTGKYADPIQVLVSQTTTNEEYLPASFK